MEDENIEIPDFMKAYYEGSDGEGQAHLNNLAAKYHKAQQDSRIRTAYQQAEHSQLFGRHAKKIDPEPALAFIKEEYKKHAEETAREFGYTGPNIDLQENAKTESQQGETAPQKTTEELAKEARANLFKENLQTIRQRNAERKFTP